MTRPAPADWPMVRHDPTNTGALTTATAPSTNQTLWWQTVGPGVASPVVAEGVVVVVSPRGSLAAFDADHGLRLWTNELAAEVFATPTIDHAAVFVTTTAGNAQATLTAARSQLYSFDLRSGRLRWRSPLVYEALASPMPYDGHVFVTTLGGYVHSFNESTGEQLWLHRIQNEISVTPALANGILYIGSADAHMYALDARSGQVTWKTFLGWQVGGVSPTFGEDQVFVSFARGVFAVDAASGALRWTFPAPIDVQGSPAYGEGKLYVGVTDGTLYALDARTGAPDWRFVTGGPIWGPPALSGDAVIVPSLDGAVYALDRQTGALRWRFDTDAAFDSSPALAGGRVYVTSHDGTLYAIGQPAGLGDVGLPMVLFAGALATLCLIPARRVGEVLRERFLRPPSR